jgi:DNA-binding FadR family transcriptional regulator
MKILMEELVNTADPIKIHLLDFEFFRQLALASKNIVYMLLMSTIKTIYDKYLYLFLPSSTNLNTSLQQEILEAVINRDEEKAAQSALKFLQRGLVLLKSLKSARE